MKKLITESLINGLSYSQENWKKDDCYQFIKKHSLSISARKEAKSTAVTDNVLLCALLLQSIQCYDFAEKKLEITKDLDMEPIYIIESLKPHQLALDPCEQYSSLSRTSNDFTTSRDSMVRSLLT